MKRFPDQPACQDLCPRFQDAMEVLARPWTGLIIALLQDGPLRFSELSERIPALGDRMLAGRLKELEAAGVLLREVDVGPPVRVAYELTKAGHGFEGVYRAMQRWGRALQEERRKPPKGKPRTARKASAAQRH